MRKQRGIGLVELMVSVLLTSILVILATQQYLVSKRQYFHVHTLLEQDFELQLINDLLRDSVRRAGFTPCLSINSLPLVDQRNSKTKLSAIEINEKHDQLKIRRMSEYFTTVIKILSQDVLLVNSELQFNPQQVLLIVDCYHGEILPIASVRKTTHGTLIKLTRGLSFNYSSPIYLGEWIEESFFIQTNRQGNRALYYRRLHAEELTDRVNTLWVNLETHQSHTWVKLIWGLEQTKPLQIVTEVRAG